MKPISAFSGKNWGLKLLALVLAIVIYYAMRDTLRDSPQSLIIRGGPADAATTR